MFDADAAAAQIATSLETSGALDNIIGTVPSSPTGAKAQQLVDDVTAAVGLHRRDLSRRPDRDWVCEYDLDAAGD